MRCDPRGPKGNSKSSSRKTTVAPSPAPVIADWIPRFHYITEESETVINAFLALWPHRYDYIQASHPLPGESPDWKTQSEHPLSDRLILQASHLYGVRFGAMTRYLMIDIDVSSQYHPRNDPFAIARMLTVLEPLGFIRPVICTSSYSGGIHIYFPFQQEQESWKIALVVQLLLENAGFYLNLGTLELFPNPRPYASSLSLYNAHRLPMQAGSYLVDYRPGEMEVVGGDRGTFVHRWNGAKRKNDVKTKTVDRIIKKLRRQKYGLSGKAEKFLNDLNAEIEAGWSGPRQTNRLLGRIAMRSYIFGHVLSGGQPLAGTVLIDDIVKVATNLPGYEDFCGHQHEIGDRAQEWADSVERSPRYYPYGTNPINKSCKASTVIKPGQLKLLRKQSAYNQRRWEEKREQIRLAIAQSLETGTWPSGITERCDQLMKLCAGSKQTIYDHRDLWHPEDLRLSEQEAIAPEPESSEWFEPGAVAPPDSDQTDAIKLGESADCAEGAAAALQNHPSLLAENERTLAQDKAFLEAVVRLELSPVERTASQEGDCEAIASVVQNNDAKSTNPLREAGLLELSLDGACDRQIQPASKETEAAPMPQHIKQMLFQLKQQRGRSPLSPSPTPAEPQLQDYWEAIAPKDEETGDAVAPTPMPESIKEKLLELAQEAEQRKTTSPVPLRSFHPSSEASESLQRQLERMRQYAASGDRVLMAEAQAWARQNPGLLDEVLEVESDRPSSFTDHLPNS